MSKKNETFLIQHIDSLGQGVSKERAQITFIPKTLPGEEGLAFTTSRKKTVQFARLKEITKPSPFRKDSECPHFNDCPGCSFLHTDYEYEIELKKTATLHGLKSLLKESTVDLETFKAPLRFGYRNRLQLHYDKKERKLGLLMSDGIQILPIPSCLLPKSEVKKEINQLYKNDHWISLLQNAPKKGHLEIYQKEDKCKISINRPYANGGFTQVYQEMNQILQDYIEKYLDPQGNLIDLFGGSGNLSKNFVQTNSLVIDSGEAPNQLQKHQIYKQINIYHPGALQKIKEAAPRSLDGLILDPPRSGLKNLESFITELNPEWFCYISCFYPTMVRDLRPIIGKYHIQKAALFDFFPGTKHLETCIILKKAL